MNLQITCLDRIKHACFSSCHNAIVVTHELSEDQDYDGSLFFLSVQLPDKGLARITHGLEDPCMQVIRRYKLYLCENNLSPRAALLLSELMDNSHNLVELSMGSNFIGDEGAEYLSSALRNNHALKILNLERNGIGYRGASCLARALSTESKASSLEWLVLSENPVGNKGARSLLNCIRNAESMENLLTKCNHTLYSIVLKKVNVTDRTILREMQSFLRINRLCGLTSNGAVAAAKRKIRVCVRERPNLLLEYIIQRHKEECGIMFKLQPEMYSFFGENLATIFHVLRQHPLQLCSYTQTSV